MKINTTEAERRRNFEEDLVKKLKLEKILARDILAIYKRASLTGAMLYGSTGTYVDMLQFKPDFSAALLRHYKRTFKVFDNPFNINISQIAQRMKQDRGVLDENLVQQNQDAFLDTEPDTQGLQIAMTADTRWRRTAEGVLALLLLGGSDTDHLSPDIRESTARAARLKFNDESLAAADTVGLTETQNGAESNRFFIAAAFIGGVTSSMKKRWVTILDGKERPSHHKASGQEQPIRTPYLVQGQQLQHPRDASLGATADNIVNCRCSSIYIVR